jgi:hypothetical protein
MAMKFIRNLAAAALLSNTIVLVSPSVFADTETTTVKTTTVRSNGQEFTLPTTSTYALVDPITGNVKGNFDPALGLTDMRLVQSGLVIINKDTGNVIATVDSNGRPINVSSAPAFDSLVMAIDTRRSDLERMITDALSKGTINAEQAGNLRADLSKIESEELAAKQSGGVLTYSEALSLALALNSLGDRLMPFAQTTVITPLLGARFISADGQLRMVDGIEYRKFQLRQRIDDEYTAGRLSAQQVASLKNQLNEVASLETKYRKNGELSSSKTEKISAKLDKVKTNLDQDIAIINNKRSKIGLRVD